MNPHHQAKHPSQGRGVEFRTSVRDHTLNLRAKALSAAVTAPSQNTQKYCDPKLRQFSHFR